MIEFKSSFKDGHHKDKVLRRNLEDKILNLEKMDENKSGEILKVGLGFRSEL